MPAETTAAAISNVPFLDLKAQLATIRDEIEPALQEVLNNTAFALGPAVQRFEQAYAQYCGVDHCVAVNSGTSALHMALVALGIGPGDEVILPGMTFIASAWPVLYVGATPRFVDVDPKRYTLDPQQVEKAITRKTRAIMPVHLYGQCADMDPLLELAASRDIAVIEDAAQAHGAVYKGRRAGSMGRLACFSFYPGKNLGAYGEGGAVVTRDAELASRCRALRDHGQTQKHHHEMLGFNYRMEGFQGAVLGVKLPHLDEWNAGRRRVAQRYHQELAGCGVELPRPCPDGEHVYHVYAVRCAERDAVQANLKEQGIGTNMHYPIPVHLQKPFAFCNQPAGSLPVAEDLGRSELSLPMYAELTDAQVDRVIAAVRSAAGN